MPSLSDLANVTSSDKPSDVKAHVGPPVSFGNQCMCSEEASVSHVVVCCDYGVDMCIAIEYSFVCTLPVMSPKYGDLCEEIGCISNYE